MTPTQQPTRTTHLHGRLRALVAHTVQHAAGDGVQQRHGDVRLNARRAQRARGHEQRVAVEVLVQHRVVAQNAHVRVHCVVPVARRRLLPTPKPVSRSA